MTKKVRNEVERLIKALNLECSVKEFQDKVNWRYISEYQLLSVDFIREFKDEVYWLHISAYQLLSEDFIREFKNKVNWELISAYQSLSEDFIREFKDKVYWGTISAFQRLSEDFIREFKDKVDWYYIPEYQNLSEDFIREFQDKIDIEVYKAVHEEKSLEQKTKEVEEYAKKHNLQVKDGFLYAFRNHDQFGRGAYNVTIFYEKGKYYKDWHCDMRKNEENSFGLGIYPEGNTPVKVKIEDWGVEVTKNDGKARVWGFEVI